MEDLVSIIMPSYNTGKFIKETIQSVLAQTYKNWELIIVDDCSTDNTDDVIASFADKRIRYIKNEINSGAAVSRNRALREAKGVWVAFLDSDDIWVSNKLEKQIKFMKENHYKFSYTKYEMIDEDSNSLDTVISGPKRITRAGMYNFCWPGCLTVMYSAKDIGLVQIEDLKKNNDYAMWLKVICKYDCYLFEEILAKYRKREGSISNNSKFKLIKHHYYLYRYGEHRNLVSSCVLTIRNLFFGVIKKLVYREKV